jgi:hypothetical protein
MSEHKHKVEMVGHTWTCWGHADKCGMRMPACFKPVPEACTTKGLIDLAMFDMVGANPFIAEHMIVVEVK